MTIVASTVAITLICSTFASKDLCRVVDGDTIWYQGTKVRVIGYDTPGPQTGICGGAFEKQLAGKATARFTELLNAGTAKIHYIGRQDRYGRELADITVNGRGVGDIPISEGLARSYPDGNEFWCS